MRTEGDGPADLRLGRRQLLAAGVAGGSLLRLRAAAPAFADQALDIQMLQTSASIENAAVTAYDIILGLPLFASATANATLKSLMTAARDHHADHAEAFNDAASRLGGRTQTANNPALAQVVNRERGRLTDLGAVIDLAVQLETAAAQTYQNNVAALGDLNARKLSASVMGVEAQHLGVLHVARALAAARMPELITLDAGTGARLPADAARAGFPDTFSTVDQARPAGEGAIG